MGRSVSLFLVRAAGFVLAGMLLLAAVGHAHAENLDGYGFVPAGSGTQVAQADTGAASGVGANYGLKRFNGDNYDSVPPGAGIPPVPAPQGYAPVPGTGAAPTGYYSALNPGTAPATAPQVYEPPPATAVPAAAYAPAPQAPYGYRPEMPTASGNPTPTAPAYPQQRLAAADPYAYYRGAPGRPADAARANPDYVLGAGDKIHLTVFGETDLSGDFAVDGSGFVRLPLIGQVHAAGDTAPQLEAMVGSALAQGYLKSPRISIEVTAYRPFYIIGAVNRPGEYPYINHMNALNAVALAGGYQNGAVESVVFVRREGSNKEIQLPTDRTTQIYPGDVIRVHFTLFNDAMSLFSPISGIAATAATAAIIQ